MTASIGTLSFALLFKELFAKGNAYRTMQLQQIEQRERPSPPEPFEVRKIV